MELQDLDNDRLDDYKKLLDSDLFTLDELDHYVGGVNEKGASASLVGQLTDHSQTTICAWANKGILKGKRVGRNWAFGADAIIKAKKILGVGREGIIWHGN